MAKRAAEDDGGAPLKSGDRPIEDVITGEGEEFEDEYEDEFESEDEILEAGVDGRPDEEREAEQAANGRPINSPLMGDWIKDHIRLTRSQAQWMWIKIHLSPEDTNSMLARLLHQI